MQGSAKALRVICHLLGCICAADYPACHRCGAGIYEDFIQIGRLDFAFRAYWRMRRFVEKFAGRKCEICHRRFWSRSDDATCSDECFTKWLPF